MVTVTSGMLPAAAAPPAAGLSAPVGELLRQWRARRRLSQLDLASQADISARHLSFVETGRSTPSREMVLHLADELEVPLRERNDLLLAAGHAAVRLLLDGHEPYPAMAVDRRWNMLDANGSISVFTDGVAADLLEPPVNVLRASLHPRGMASRIMNLGECRAHLLSRLHRQAVLTGDPELAALHDELRRYPCAQPEPHVEVPGPGDVFVPLRIRHQGAELAFFSTFTTVGTPLDITVAELMIESFFPADAGTAAVMRARAA
jgi:transcriptional regulator with XRE-family HTH domain